jgi:hypothetical protein
MPIYPLSHGVITPPVLNTPARDEDQRMLSPQRRQAEDTPLASQASAPLPEADPPLSLNDLAWMFTMFLCSIDSTSCSDGYHVGKIHRTLQYIIINCNGLIQRWDY